MTLQYDVAVRNAKLDGVVRAIGTGPELRLLTGPAPASCASAETGVLLAALRLPAAWMAAAADGVIAKAGAWGEAKAVAAGEPGYFRLVDGLGLCRMQGSVGKRGAVMVLTKPRLEAGMLVGVSAFSISDNNG